MSGVRNAWKLRPKRVFQCSGIRGRFYSAEFDPESAEQQVSHFSQLPPRFGENQHMVIDSELKELLRLALWDFRAPIRYAVAYGSGVFRQAGRNASDKPMIDLLLGVTWTQHWHSLNITQHCKHYSALRYLGSGAVSLVQDRIGAGVYFNPYVEMHGLRIKYGVVNLETLYNDLLRWDTLYLAGRLHKPVKILRDEPRIRVANQRNLLSALRAALLLLPERFSEMQLYSTIAGISYMGDLRMQLATENPHKIENIVSTQAHNFRRLYEPLIANLPNLAHASVSTDSIADSYLSQDMDPLRRGNMVSRLPAKFRTRLYHAYRRKFGMPITIDELSNDLGASKGGEFEQRIAGDTQGLKRVVSKVMRQTVFWPSTTQSLKGWLTAGVRKSAQYVTEKIGKWWRAERNRQFKDV